MATLEVLELENFVFELESTYNFPLLPSILAGALSALSTQNSYSNLSIQNSLINLRTHTVLDISWSS